VASPGFTGRQHTIETRARISASNRGKHGGPKSAEHRQKLRVALRKSIEDLDYYSWHRWQLSEHPKIGVCTTCSARPEPHARNSVGTEWSYVGDDPRGWEPDHAKYVEECKSCHQKRTGTALAGRKLTAEHVAKVHGPRIACPVCGLVSTRAGVGRHRSAREH
jgi:hypothetical protein